MKRGTSILFILVLTACGKKSELLVKDASQEICNCFNAQIIGSVDERLSPCLQDIVDRKHEEWNNSGITDQDSIDSELSKFSLNLILEITRSCKNYFAEINSLYENGYPLDTTESNRKVINELSIRINRETSRDSIKSLLHKKVQRLIQAREFDMALQNIDSIKSLDSTDYGANLSKAYIYNQKGLHDDALFEINKAIVLSGNEGLKVYAEVTKMKQNAGK